MDAKFKDSQIGLDQRSKELRHLVIESLSAGQRGHVGATLSLIEILRVLYDDVLCYDPKNPQMPDRDRCILAISMIAGISAGHPVKWTGTIAFV